MFKRLFSGGLACICLAILLSSCGLTSLFSQGGGPVSISTDQTAYHTGNTIQVSVTNNLQTPVYVYNGQAGCSILLLSTQVGNGWTQSNAAPCTQKLKTNVVKIDAGQTYKATIKGTFAPGTYRFSLIYSTNPSMALSDNGRKQNTIVSPSFSFSK